MSKAATFPEGCQTVTLLDQLRERRATARTTAEAILTRAAETGEPMTAEDLAAHSRAVADEREAADAIEAPHSNQLAELRASIARTPGATGTPAGDVLNREQSVADWCRTRGHTGFDEPVSFSRYLKGLATGDWINVYRTGSPEPLDKPAILTRPAASISVRGSGASCTRR